VVALFKRSYRDSVTNHVSTLLDVQVNGSFSYSARNQLHWSGYVHLRAATAPRRAASDGHHHHTNVNDAPRAIDDAYTLAEEGHVC